MKKAQLFEGALILVALAVCGMTLYYTALFSTRVSAETVSIEKAVEMFSEAEKENYYLKDYANLAVQEAYAKTAKNPATCAQLGTITIWGESCRPNNQEARNKLKDEFNGKMAVLGKQFSSEIKDDIKIKFFPHIFNASSSGKIFNYTLTYAFSPEFSVPYPEIDFEEIYSASLSQDKSNIKFENWDYKAETSGNYYIFTMTSKKSYLHDNSFKPVIFSFALKKQ